MTTENSTPIVPEDLDAFSTEFFTGKPAKAEKVEVEGNDAEDTSFEDDALANHEEVTETDAEEEDNDSEQAPPEKPKKQTAQERIQELNAKFREAERRALEAEQKLKEREAPKAEVKTETPIAVGAPTPTDKNEDGTDKYPLGEFDPNFSADLAKFSVKQAWEEIQKEEVAKASQKAQEEATKALTTNWEARLQEAETGDFTDIRKKGEAIVNEFSAIPEEYGNYLAQTIMSLDKGVEVLNYLADNLDEARKIVASGPTAATIALGELHSMFKRSNGNVKPKVTAAPEPPKALNRGSNGKFAVAPDTDDLDAFADIFFTKK